MKTETRRNMKHDNSVAITHSVNLIISLSKKKDSMNSRKRKVIPWFESLKILRHCYFEIDPLCVNVN